MSDDKPIDCSDTPNIDDCEYNPSDQYSFEKPTDLWTYRARPDPDSDYPHGVADGDTYDVEVDFGFNMRGSFRLRGVHVDTGEIWGAQNSAEYQAARAHREFARDWMANAIERAEADPELPTNWPLLLRTRWDRGKYGRLLAEVFAWDGDSLERSLIEEFHGDEYFRWGDLY